MPSLANEHGKTQQLIEHQERVLDLVQVGSWEWDPLHDRTYWSKGLYRIFGVEPVTHNASLQGYLERVHPEDLERVAVHVSKAVESKTPMEHESRIIRPDGSLRVIEAIGHPVIDPKDGQLLRYLGTVRDVTRQREREAELQRDERLASAGNLTSGIAHQFNIHLMTVRSHLWCLKADLPKSEGRHKDLEAIAQAVDRGAALVEQLQAFSGKQVQPIESVDLNSKLKHLAPMVREIVADDTDLIVDLTSGVGHVMINADQLEQVILTLAETAREVMSEGGGTVTIRTQVVPGLPDRARTSPGASAPSHYVLLTVSDTGPGIDKEHLTRVFDPFFSSKGWNEELDAGLAAAYGIVRGSGGHIEVDSSPDEGCRFSLYFPGVEDSRAPAVGHRSPDSEHTVVNESAGDCAKGALMS